MQKKFMIGEKNKRFENERRCVRLGWFYLISRAGWPCLPTREFFIRPLKKMRRFAVPY